MVKIMEQMSFGICPQCNMMHPPLPPGAKCPMSKEKAPSGEVIDYESFFTPLKNILTSQIQSKNIKDTKKFLGNILVDITKLSEEYKEN